MRFIAPVLVLAFGLSTPLSLLHADSQVQVIYDKLSHPRDQASLDFIKREDITAPIIDLINNEFKLKQKLRIRFGGADGPLYDPQRREIVIPYAFVQEVKTRFVKDRYGETGVSPEEATADALEHTLFHEVAHALIDMYELPVVGKEEDAADNLANILLIEYWAEGAEVALSAAALFDMESNDSDTLEEADFWDEHSLDAQRYYTTLCHVYGSDPDTYKTVKADAGFSAERAESCEEEYAILAENWFKLLKPLLKKPQA